MRHRDSGAAAKGAKWGEIGKEARGRIYELEG